MFQVGLGYRKKLHDELLAIDPYRLDFVEIAPENYIGLGGNWRRRLEEVRSRWPILTHGLALSVGGEAPLDRELIRALAEFTESIATPHHSDHLCFSSIEGTHLHDLLPMACTRTAAKRTAERIKEVQAELPVPFAIENVSAYVRRKEDELDEPEFLTEVVERSGCKILLDVNNVFVNATNFGQDAHDMLRRMPAEAAVQIHIAGFLREQEDLLIDTHGEAIADPVWPLLEEALRRTGPVPVLLERDHNIPALEVLMREVEQIRAIGARVFGGGRREREAAYG
jgi:uncharacterized protein (UPF0276 family)